MRVPRVVDTRFLPTQRTHLTHHAAELRSFSLRRYFQNRPALSKCSRRKRLLNGRADADRIIYGNPLGVRYTEWRRSRGQQLNPLRSLGEKVTISHGTSDSKSQPKLVFEARARDTVFN